MGLWAQSITSSISTDSLSVGDTFTFSISANYRTSDFTVIYPDANIFRDPFEVLTVQRFRGVTSQDSIVYNMQFFGVKDTVLISKPVYFIAGTDTSALRTVAIPIKFRSNLVDDGSELKPFKPIFGFAPPWLTWLVLGLILSLIIYGAWYFWQSFARNTKPVHTMEQKEIPPFISPLFVFEKSLREFKDTSKYKDDQYVGLHIQLSNAIRNYYEDVYNILALESTTKEITNSLEQNNIDDTVISLSQEILRKCDLIKFAKAEASLHDVVLILDISEKLRDLFRHFDENRLKKIRTEYEIKYGLRKENEFQNGAAEIQNIKPEVK